ncbi:hypothetical protein ERJ75_001410000 [Trypanosoma vivax]|nr:hypothetical protein ERJ75_001410000 [Trypanosoma vivax]
MIKAQSRDPRLVVLASEAGRVAKQMWTGPAWEQRMSLMRRFGEFTKKRGLRTSRGHVPLFIVSLKLAKSSGGMPHKARAANDAVEAGPRLQRDGVREGPRSNAARVGRGELLVRNRAAAEEKLYQAPGRPQRPHCRLVCSAKNIRGGPALSGTLCGDRGCGRYHFEKGCCEDGGLGAARRTGAKRGGKILRPCSVAARSIKRGAPAHAAAAQVEHDLDPRILTQLGKRADPLELPRRTARCLGRWAAVLNSCAKLAVLM